MRAKTNLVLLQILKIWCPEISNLIDSVSALQMWQKQKTWIYLHSYCQLKKDAQGERCELSIIEGQMKTVAWEVASQLWETVQKWSQGKVNIHDFGEGEVQCNQALILQKVFCWPWVDVIMKGFSVFLDMKSCKDWDHEINFWKYLTI